MSTLARFTCVVLAVLLPASLSIGADDDDLAQALGELRNSIERSEHELRDAPAFGSDAERAGAYMHLSRMLLRSLEEHVLQDADYPYFRVLDQRIREGGDNPDQRYLFSPIRPGATYRIWGDRGSATRVEFQLYAGKPWSGSGRVAGFLDFDTLAMSPEGAFEVYLSPQRMGENWLENAADTDTLIVRQIYADWNAAYPGQIHIDRLDTLGTPRPAYTTADVAARLRAAAQEMHSATTVWPNFVAQRYLDRMPANTISPLMDTATFGGVNGRWMANGHFELHPDEVLLIRTWPTDAAYQGLQLTDLWFASLDYADRVSSLNTHQALLAADGSYYFAVSASDPGYANWLDTGGLERGVFLLRFDGLKQEIPRAQWPSVQLVKRTELRESIPGFAEVSAAARAETLRERRRHVQVRYND